MKTTFAERLAELIYQHGISQAVLSLRMGADPANVSRMLSNKRNPSLSTLRRIILALPACVDVRALITGEETHDVDEDTPKSP